MRRLLGPLGQSLASPGTRNQLFAVSGTGEVDE
jgi:hypothetical protein